MSANTKIQWADHTFNPWRGCEKVSPGCQFCYAESQAKLNPKVLGEWGKGARRAPAAESYWREPLRWNAKAKAAGIRRRVFCLSLGDVFDAAIPFDWRARLFEIIEACDSLDWLLLTKRPENIRPMIAQIATPMCEAWDCEDIAPAHVWLGTSAENQAWWNLRIEPLLEVPAALHFVSIEPMLGPIELIGTRCSCPDWIIVGGESGPNARPFALEWGLDVYHQCDALDIPLFMKQLGRHPYAENVNLWDETANFSADPPESCEAACAAGLVLRDPKGGDPAEWPVEFPSQRRFPKTTTLS